MKMKILIATLIVVCICFGAAFFAAVSDNESLKKHNESIQERLVPRLPVSISFRNALLGPGLVLQLTTTVKQRIQLRVTIRNEGINTSKTWTIHLDANGTTELGHLEGAVIERGDTITLENGNYKTAVYTVGN